MANVVQVNDLSDIVFAVGVEEVLRFEPNGVVYVYGEQVDSNQRVYQAMINFLVDAGQLTVKTEWDDAEVMSIDNL